MLVIKRISEVQLAIAMVSNQQAADEFGGDGLGGVGEEGLWVVLVERGGYGSVLECSRHITAPNSILTFKIFNRRSSS